MREERGVNSILQNVTGGVCGVTGLSDFNLFFFVWTAKLDFYFSGIDSNILIIRASI